MKRIFAIFLTIVLIFVLCSCASPRSQLKSSSEAMENFFEPPYSSNNDANISSASLSEGFYKSVTSDNTLDAVPSKQYDKIIYSADVTLETTLFDETIDEISDLISNSDGCIDSSSISGVGFDQLNNDSPSARYACYTIRVPSSNFDVFISSLSDIGNVTYQNVYSDNITSQYYDAEARLNNYKLQENALLELLEKAQNVSDVIEIERELADVRSNIESLQSTMNRWDNQIDYSTVYVNINEVIKYSPSIDATFMSRLESAFSDGIDMFVNIVIWLVSIFPIVLILIALVIVTILIINGIRKRSYSKVNYRGSSDFNNTDRESIKKNE